MPVLYCEEEEEDRDDFPVYRQGDFDFSHFEQFTISLFAFFLAAILFFLIDWILGPQ